jgi:hypothetical protein
MTRHKYDEGFERKKNLKNIREKAPPCGRDKTGRDREPLNHEDEQKERRSGREKGKEEGRERKSWGKKGGH